MSKWQSSLDKSVADQEKLKAELAALKEEVRKALEEGKSSKAEDAWNKLVLKEIELEEAPFNAWEAQVRLRIAKERFACSGNGFVIARARG